MDENQEVQTGAQITLRHSPTGGAPGEHSPYYRRLLSAGYKGFLQGVIGGATLYGIMGAAIGGIIVGGMALSGVSLATIPIWPIIGGLAGIGVFKGASTFGNIGSIAAITAESAEMSEKRNYLLERYYDLPLSPEYDGEAREIERMLNDINKSKAPPYIFHWKTMLVCAVLGAAVGVGLVYAAPYLLSYLHLTEVAELGAGVGIAKAIIAGTIGALAGTMVGLDRYYVRRWLDVSENLLHDPEHTREAERQRAQEVERLVNASPTRGAETSRHRGQKGQPQEPTAMMTPAYPMPQQPVIYREQPSTRINAAELYSRLADIQEAMRRPAV